MKKRFVVATVLMLALLTWSVVLPNVAVIVGSFERGLDDWRAFITSPANDGDRIRGREVDDVDPRAKSPGCADHEGDRFILGFARPRVQVITVKQRIAVDRLQQPRQFRMDQQDGA